MLRIVRRRVLISIPLLLVVSLTTFVLESLVPGNLAASLLGENYTQAQYNALRQSMHLNQPLAEQYWRYLTGVFQGHLGDSLVSNESVTTAISERLPVTLTLIVGAVVVAAAVGIFLGVQSAIRGRFWRRLVDVLSLLGVALPSFWLGLVLVAFFAVRLGWFPATGYTPFSTSPYQWLQSLALPVVALSVLGIASISKVTRDGMLSALQTEYTKTLRAAGVSQRSLIWKHGLRNSSVAIATMIGLTAVQFIAATVFIENVFALPGMGLLIVNATVQHDLPVVQGVTLVFTLLVIAINLIIDLCYGALDPKVRLS